MRLWLQHVDEHCFTLDRQECQDARVPAGTTYVGLSLVDTEFSFLAISGQHF